MPAELPAANRTALSQWFDDNFRSRGEVGASLSVWQDGAEVLSLAAGWHDRGGERPWAADTLVPVFSATKAPAAVCALMALEQARLPLDCPVAEAWPAFAGGGKHTVTFGQLLSHRAGLSALDERVPIQDTAAVLAAVERQTPLWTPGTRQGYHARTFGFLLEGIVRHLSGAASVGEFFHERLGRPMGLAFWIGLPREHWERVAPLYPGKISLGQSGDPFLKAFGSAGTLTQRSFTSPAGLNAISDFNRPEAWAHGYASMGGVGSARGLGAFYAMLAQGGRWNGRQLVPASVVRQLSEPLSQAEDAVLLTPLAFAAGVMQDPRSADGGAKLRRHYGPALSAFGHPGAGGSLAFADPERGLAFAYVMNQMEVGALPGPKSLGLVERLYA